MIDDLIIFEGGGFVPDSEIVAVRGKIGETLLGDGGGVVKLMEIDIIVVYEE